MSKFKKKIGSIAVILFYVELILIAINAMVVRIISFNGQKCAPHALCERGRIMNELLMATIFANKRGYVSCV